jgi:uncharacterized SAM-dependent methyltransferase
VSLASIFPRARRAPRRAPDPQAPSEAELHAALHAELYEEIVAGLRLPAKRLPCKLLYDETGAALFDRICELEAYYPTRTELSILRAHIGEIAARIGPRARVVEFGSGSGVKTRILLRRLDSPVAYTPIDISAAQLADFARRTARAHPRLEVLPVHGDFTRPVSLPRPSRPAARTVAFFPGSTIGNLEPLEAERFLRRTARLCGAGGKLLIGVDLRKDRRTLDLRHINRRYGADFDLEAFWHRAIFNDAESRIEMHLLSRRGQWVHLRGPGARLRVRIAAGESIVTEYSYKYEPEGFARIAERAGFAVERAWIDPRRLFSVQLLALPG